MKRRQRRQRRQRGRDRSRKWGLVNLVIDKLEQELSISINNSFMWSANTWGGSRCHECGLEVPSKALFDRGVTYLLNPQTKEVVSRATSYLTPCLYVSNCGGFSTWDQCSFPGAKAKMKKDWKLILFRNLKEETRRQLLCQ